MVEGYVSCMSAASTPDNLINWSWEHLFRSKDKSLTTQSPLPSQISTNPRQPNLHKCPAPRAIQSSRRPPKLWLRCCLSLHISPRCCRGVLPPMMGDKKSWKMRKIIGVCISLQISIKKKATRINVPYISHVSTRRCISKPLKGKAALNLNSGSATD